MVTFIGSMMANKPVLSGCDILNLFVDEAGAFNSRCLGSAALPMVLWKDGYEGEVPLQGVAGTIFVDIAPMEPASSGVPATVEQSAPVIVVEASAPQAAQAFQDFAGFKAALPSEARSSSEARGSSEGQAVGSQPWVTAMLSVSPTAVLVEETDTADEPAVAAQSLMQVSHQGPLPPPPPPPITPYLPQQQAAFFAVGSGVPASRAENDGRMAAALPINLSVAALNVAQIISQLSEQHKRSNHNFLPYLPRGVDTRKDLTWLAFGFDVSTKSFPIGDEMDYESGPARVDLASRLHSSLGTLSRNQMSPQFGLIVICFQDRIGRQLWVP